MIFSDEEIVFNPNPFIRIAGWYETPKIAIDDSWVTSEYGYEVFKSSNRVSRWIYIVISEGLTIMATPEAMADKQAIRDYIKYIL